MRRCAGSPGAVAARLLSGRAGPYARSALRPRPRSSSWPGPAAQAAGAADVGHAAARARDAGRCRAAAGHRAADGAGGRARSLLPGSSAGTAMAPSHGRTGALPPPIDAALVVRARRRRDDAGARAAADAAPRHQSVARGRDPRPLDARPGRRAVGDGGDHADRHRGVAGRPADRDAGGDRAAHQLAGVGAVAVRGGRPRRVVARRARRPAGDRARPGRRWRSPPPRAARCRWSAGTWCRRGRW